MILLEEKKNQNCQYSGLISSNLDILTGLIAELILCIICVLLGKAK